MTITLSGQLLEFFYAALMGAALGVLYDVFKVLRLIGLNFRLAAFIEDVLFFLIATVTVFSFYMQVTDGKFRIIVLVAAFLGFVLYSITIERPIFFIIRKIYDIISKIFAFIYKKIVLPLFKLLLKLLKWILSPVKRVFCKIFCQNIAVFFKKLLQKTGKMLYNNRRIHKGKRGRVKDAGKEQKNKEKAFYC